VIILRRSAVHSIALSLGASLLLGLPADARADRGMSTNILKGLYTNHVRTTPEAGNPGLRTRTYAADVSTAFENARTVAAGMSRWKIAKADPATGTIAAEARTRWMRFVDDVTITVTPGETGGSVVNVASRSRVGLGDLGVNARRVSNYLKALDKVMDAKGGM
jgi:uncharacterized protein (DUF1499 family)